VTTGDRRVPTWAGRATAVPVLGGDDVQLWLVELDVDEAEHAQLRELLSAGERDRADAYRFPVHRHRYAVGRARLRQLLAAYLDEDPARLELADGPTGKPELAWPTGSGLRLNLAHCEGLALCAVARREVGVDLELVDRRRFRWSPVAARFFHAEEQRVLGRATGPEGWVAFLRVWTLKEACLKAAGVGLVADPRSFSVAEVLEGGTSVVTVAGRRWRCEELRPAPGTVAALATEL
jgi:4'-phosphopantetheinyl transferase